MVEDRRVGTPDTDTQAGPSVSRFDSLRYAPFRSAPRAAHPQLPSREPEDPQASAMSYGATVGLAAARGGTEVIMAVTGMYRLTKDYDAPPLARFPWRRSRVVWSFVYLVLRRALELVLLCFRSARPRRSRSWCYATSLWCCAASIHGPAWSRKIEAARSSARLIVNSRRFRPFGTPARPRGR
jgi:hypothetical protein